MIQPIEPNPLDCWWNGEGNGIPHLGFAIGIRFSEIGFHLKP